jgi:hypothetical protein
VGGYFQDSVTPEKLRKTKKGMLISHCSSEMLHERVSIPSEPRLELTTLTDDFRDFPAILQKMFQG